MAAENRLAAVRPTWGAHRGASFLTVAASAVTAFALCLSAAPAGAQTYVPGFYESGPDNTDPGLSIPERFTQRQLPYGAQFGALWFYPSLQLDESLNDNIFATAPGRQGDAITTLTGRTFLSYSKDDSTLGLQSYLAGHKYAIHSSEDSWEGSTQLSYSKLIHDDAKFLFNGDIKRLVDPRTDPTGLQGLHPTTYEIYDGNVGLLLGHIERNSLDLRVGTDRTTYDPLRGSLGPIITNDRNNTELFGEGTFRYASAPGRDLYLKVRPNSRDYDLKFDQSGFQRSSNGVRVDAGADWDIDAALLLNVEAGVQHQVYDDRRFGTIDEPDGRVKLSWWPTRLTNVTMNYTHEYYEAFFTPSPGAIRDKVVTRIDHELRRRWIASAALTVERDALRNVTTRYLSENAMVSLQYLFADGFSAAINYNFAHQTNTGVVAATGANSFQQNIVTFTVKKLF